MRIEYEEWEEAMRILVEVREAPTATPHDNAVAVRRAGETMAALLRRMVVVIDRQQRTIERSADTVAVAIEAGDEEVRRTIDQTILPRLRTFEDRISRLEEHVRGGPDAV